MASSGSSGSSSSPLALETPASSTSGQRDLSVEIKAESPPDTTLFQGMGKPKKKRKGRVIGVLRWVSALRLGDELSGANYSSPESNCRSPS